MAYSIGEIKSDVRLYVCNMLNDDSATNTKTLAQAVLVCIGEPPRESTTKIWCDISTVAERLGAVFVLSARIWNLNLDFERYYQWDEIE